MHTLGMKNLHLLKQTPATIHSLILHMPTSWISMNQVPCSVQGLLRYHTTAVAHSQPAQSLKVLQPFDEAGDLQEWCEKCGFAWSNFLHGIYYILGLTNQLKFVTIICNYTWFWNQYWSLTERKLEQNSVIQTVYNCKATKFDLNAAYSLISHGHTSCDWFPPLYTSAF